MKNRGTLYAKRLIGAVVICLLLLAVTGSAVVGAGEILFGQAEQLGPMVNSHRGEFDVTYSADGLEIYYTSNRHRSEGLNDFDIDIYVTTRDDVNAPWKPPISLGPAINSPSWDEDPFLTSDGLTLYFDSLRPWGVGDLWMTTRKTKDDNWGPAVNLGPIVNSQGYTDEDPSVTADGLELYFSSDRSGPRWQYRLWVTTRQTIDDDWRTPVDLGPVLNGTYSNISPTISHDGLILVFVRVDPENGDNDLWMTKRPSRDADWGVPEKLPSVVNIMNNNTCPDISPDGHWLRWCSANVRVDVDSWDIWQAPILPVVDFDGDGQVDEADMALLVASLGRDEPVCDIAPYAWGDGIVDDQDLAVWMGAAMTPGANATKVPWDVILNWVSPVFAQGHDVYLGTSFDDVSKATREDPRGVLVSMGQPGITYTPEVPLDVDQTYYWRVDVVAGPPEGSIHTGLVLCFTTLAFAYPIENIAAAASSQQDSMGPERTIDGSGLDADSQHSTEAATMWLSLADGPQPTWIQYEFDDVYPLHEMWVWNYNGEFEQIVGNGFRNVTIEYSEDGVSWVTLGDVEFAKGTAQNDYGHNTVVEFGSVTAQYVRLTAKSTWGELLPPCGLSEVRFFYTALAEDGEEGSGN